MKTFYASLLCLCCTISTWATELKTMVFSDPHVLHTSLFTAEKDFSSQPYLTEYSQLIFDEAINTVKAAKPDLLIIPGDLTFNGDSVSHRHVASQLNALVSAGIRVVVIPGNHDINEPNAQSYTDVITGPITAQQFTSLYAECGYSDAEEVAADGLSYLIYVNSRTALVCIHSSQDNSAGHKSAGGINATTLAWAEKAAAKAIADGRYPIGVTHHQVVEHFDNQTMIDGNHVANSSDELTDPSLKQLQQDLVDAGLTTFFTGHMHIMSTKYATTRKGDFYGKTGYTLYDISTNALCGYAGAIRSLTIREGNIENMSIVNLPDMENLTAAQRTALAKQRNTNLTNSAFNMVDNQLKSHIGSTGNSMVDGYLSVLTNGISSKMREYMKADYTELFCYLTEGEEYRNPEAAETQVSLCQKDYTDFRDWLQGQMRNYANMPFVGGLFVAAVDTTKINQELTEGSALLFQTINSIMYNALGAKTNGVSAELINKVHDYDPVISVPYQVEPVTTQIESTTPKSCAHKLFRDGQLIIIREDKVYNSTGQRLL